MVGPSWMRAASEKKGGRKKASTDQPDLEENLRQIVRDHTAGDPMQAKAATDSAWFRQFFRRIVTLVPEPWGVGPRR